MSLAAIRLAAVPLGYGITGALAGGTLNRIMVAEMGLPLTLVGFLMHVTLWVILLGIAITLLGIFSWAFEPADH